MATTYTTTTRATGPATTTISSSTRPLYRGAQTVWYVLGVIETLLVFRIFLKMMGANPAAGFTEFIYSLSSPLVAPFIRVFNVTEVNGSIFEWTTLLAMFVYWIVAYGIIKLFFMAKPVSTIEAAEKLDNEEV